MALPPSELNGLVVGAGGGNRTHVRRITSTEHSSNVCYTGLAVRVGIEPTAVGVTTRCSASELPHKGRDRRAAGRQLMTTRHRQSRRFRWVVVRWALMDVTVPRLSSTGGGDRTLPTSSPAHPTSRQVDFWPSGRQAMSQGSVVGSSPGVFSLAMSPVEISCALPRVREAAVVAHGLLFVAVRASESPRSQGPGWAALAVSPPDDQLADRIHSSPV